MSLKLHGLGKITGIDQGLSVVGVTTLHNELSVSGDVVVGGGLTVTGVLTYEDVTNVDSIGIITARSGIVGDLTGNVTGDITGNIIGSPTLSGISSSISDTAVDIFVYDTSKDSDGGTWRKRTQHTSWYNETLNTATRGSRKEFPAVAVIVLDDLTTTGRMTIYDGDDPDLPMWMVFTGGANAQEMLPSFTGTKCVCLSALNGQICVGNSTYDLEIIDFLKDGGTRISVGQYINNHNISTRNNALGSSSTSIGSGLVDRAVNDVAMTVLPNAPIDDTTGLPVPTIAVATDGGTSIIKGDGTVIDITPYSDDYVAFDNNNLIIGRGDGSAIVYAGPMPNADISEVTWRGQSDVTYFGSSANIELYSSDYDPGNLTGVTKNAFSFDSSIGKVVKFDLNTTDANSTMVAYAATSYNTGWMHGDCKGAFLSDTDTTNLVEGDILGGKGTFDDASYWTAGSSWTVSGGVATSDSSGISYLTKNGILTTGARYVIRITVSSYSAGTLYVYCGTGAPGTANHYLDFSANGTYTMILDAFNTNFGLYGANFGGVVDNVTISSVVDQDRSVNAKDLGVFGTIDRDPVATGAELVAYGGFNGSNYLRQPHNADLNVGTGDFYIMCWVKGNQLMLWHRNDSGTLDMRCEFPTSGGSANKPRFLMSNGGVSLDFYATTAFDTTTWHHCVWVKRGARAGELYIDGVLNNSGTAGSDLSLDGTNSTFSIGNRADNPTEDFNGHISLFKFGASAPSAAQVKKIYEDEKMLFQENAKCTLYGSSDAVTALGYDEVTEQLHVGTSSGRSDFQGLRRINNTTTAVTTAISAHDEFIAEQ